MMRSEEPEKIKQPEPEITNKLEPGTDQLRTKP
jgi:hypothetical protein